jgi:biotin carboxyl carrier protein
VLGQLRTHCTEVPPQDEQVEEMHYRVISNSQEFEIDIDDGQETIEVTCNDKTRALRIEAIDSDRIVGFIDGRPVAVELVQTAQGCTLYYQGGTYNLRIEDAKTGRKGHRSRLSGADKTLRAPMPGIVLSVEVQPGQKVKKGAGLLVIEAMKMENEIRAPFDVEIKEIAVQVGESVNPDQELIYFA